MMRREINAYRVAYGAPLMITVCGRYAYVQWD